MTVLGDHSIRLLDPVCGSPRDPLSASPSDPLSAHTRDCLDSESMILSTSLQQPLRSNCEPEVSVSFVQSKLFSSSPFSAYASSGSFKSVSSTAARKLHFDDDNCSEEQLLNNETSIEFPISSCFAGAFPLIGKKILSAKEIFQILLYTENLDKAVRRLPFAPKSNCFFILNMDPELTEYNTQENMCRAIQDRLRDGTGAWRHRSCNNSNLFLVEDGVIQWIGSTIRIRINYNLRAHRRTNKVINLICTSTIQYLL